jgi:hypothetical protein
MVNLNYNILGGSENNRFSKQQDKGFIPFQVQYVVVGGGGGAAGGANLKAGQAGNGGEILQGGYCVYPFNNYNITIGQGGNGGAVSGSLTITTGSNGQPSSFASITASGGNGGVYQNAVTLSFFGGAGDNGVYPASNGNGGSGSQWNYNIGGGPLCYPPFGHCGEYITSSYYAGGGAGFIVGPPLLEYMVIGGGGGGGARDYIVLANQPNHGGGGWGGTWTTGSIYIYPNEQYQITIGSGGLNAQNYGNPYGTGSYGTPSYISGSNTTNPFFVSASGGQGGSYETVGGGAGGGSVPYSSSNNQNGANGIQWKDGYYYGGGGAASQQFGNGAGGWGGGGNGGGSISTGSLGGVDYTYYPFGPDSGPPGGLSSQELRSIGGYGMGAGGSGMTQLVGETGGAGGNGIVALRYLGTPIATGGQIITSGSYTYHYFASSSVLNVTLDPLLIRAGAPGQSGAVTSSNAANNTGGGAGGAFYNESGSKGGSGFVALRYEGAPIAAGGQMIGTDHYTYHIYTASGNFYAIGQETNLNINPCP